MPSSYALDSPSILSKLATPKPATVMNSDMSHVIDDATSALHDTTLPLGEFLDEHLARVRGNEIIEDAIIDNSDDENSPNDYELPVFPEG